MSEPSPEPVEEEQTRSGAGRVKRFARNRVGGLSLLLALFLLVVLIIGFLTLDLDVTPQAPVIENARIDDTSLELSGYVVSHDLENASVKWKLEFELAGLEGEDDLETLERATIESPRLLIYDDDELAAELRAERGSIDRASEVVELRGRIRAYLEPEGDDRVEISLRGPIELQLAKGSQLDTASSAGDGEVVIRNRSIDLRGRGFEIDLASGVASLQRDVQVNARLDNGGGMPGWGSGTLLLGCEGGAVFRKNGGRDGIVASITFSDEVSVIADDASRLDCQRLEIESAPGAPGFVPDRIEASGEAKLRLPGTGEISAHSMVSQRQPDGTWMTRIEAAEGHRIEGQLELGSQEENNRQQLDFSCDGHMSQARGTGNGHEIVFNGAVTGELRVAGQPAPRATLSAESKLVVALQGGKERNQAGLVSGIESLLAVGDVEIVDRPGGSPGGGDVLGGEQQYELLRARAAGSARVTVGDDGSINSVVFERDATIDLEGVDLSSLSASLSEEITADETHSDVQLTGELLRLDTDEDAGRRLIGRGAVHLREHGDGTLRRSLNCLELQATLPADAEEAVHLVARGSDEAAAIYEDHTLSQPLRATATSSIEVRGQDLIILTGPASHLSLGDDTLAAAGCEVIEVHIEAREARAPGGRLRIEVREGEAEIVAFADSVSEDAARGIWILQGTPAQQVETSGRDSRGSFELVAPRLEISPENETMSCPAGGNMVVTRLDGGGEKVHLSAAQSLSYDGNLILAVGQVHMKVQRSEWPFEIWADRAEGSIATDGGSHGQVQLRQVVATGNLRMISGDYEATGHSLLWNLITGKATLTRQGAELLQLHDRKNRVRWRALRLDFEEGEGYTGQGLQMDRR